MLKRARWNRIRQRRFFTRCVASGTRSNRAYRFWGKLVRRKPGTATGFRALFAGNPVTVPGFAQRDALRSALLPTKNGDSSKKP